MGPTQIKLRNFPIAIQVWHDSAHQNQALNRMEISDQLDWGLSEPPKPPFPTITIPTGEAVHPELWQMACDGNLPLNSVNLSLETVHIPQ